MLRAGCSSLCSVPWNTLGLGALVKAKVPHKSLSYQLNKLKLFKKAAYEQNQKEKFRKLERKLNSFIPTPFKN
jgi:hypothetical protein